jgi:tetratricopeptide (TPR) repeat protein
MSDISGDQERITQAEEDEAFLMGQMAQSTGDYFALLGRDEEAKGEYLAAISAYDRVLPTSAAFGEAQNNQAIVMKNLGCLESLLFDAHKPLTNSLETSQFPTTRSDAYSNSIDEKLNQGEVEQYTIFTIEINKDINVTIEGLPLSRLTASMQAQAVLALVKNGIPITANIINSGIVGGIRYAALKLDNQYYKLKYAIRAKRILTAIEVYSEVIQWINIQRNSNLIDPILADLTVNYLRQDLQDSMIKFLKRVE